LRESEDDREEQLDIIKQLEKNLNVETIENTDKSNDIEYLKDKLRESEDDREDQLNLIK